MITSDIFVAYSQCKLKAYFLLCTNKQEIPTDYIVLLNEETHENRSEYFKKIEKNVPNVQSDSLS